MNITFIAPPAAGKGTQAVRISQKYGIPHISTGDLLRSIDDESLKQELKSGKFASNELINELLKNRLSKEDCNQGYVIDGYPRNLKQAKDYECILQELHKDEGIIIILDLDKELSKKRVIGRMVCPNCKATFNELFPSMKEKQENICDICHHELVRRTDDNLDTFEVRYKTYERETKPLVKYYESKGNAYHVNSGINHEFTFNQIEKIIGGLYDKH